MFFYLSTVLVGLGLVILLGAPLRYVMLNEAPVGDRATAQGILTLNTSIGKMIGGATVASFGGGINGFTKAFLIVGIISIQLTMLNIGS